MSNLQLFDENDGVALLVGLMKEQLLIPIFGSGISVGAHATKYKVPDGKQTTEIMKAETLKVKPNLDLENYNFNDTAKFFFKCTNEDIQNRFFCDYFTNVRIEGVRKEIVNLNWPYAYTLNIDDGIENSSNFKAIYPYQQLRNTMEKGTKLFKIHGDAVNEINYKNKNNIAFSTEQYIIALKSEENQHISRFLKSDYVQKNIVFIGCSLKHEPDLSYLYSEISHGITGNHRILITKTNPSEAEELMLEDYGINTIILIEDYTLFFEKWVKLYHNARVKDAINQYKYIDPSVQIIKDKNDVIKSFCNTIIFDSQENTFRISDLIIKRSATADIVEKIKKNPCLLVIGRRLSGKTALIADICASMKNFSHVLFPSSDTCDEKVVASLITSRKHTLFLFDSHSITPESYKVVANALEIVQKNSNRIIIFGNSNDNFITDKLTADIIKVENSFNNDEIDLFNTKANRYGLNKRKYNHSNLDYLNYIYTEQKINSLIEVFIKQQLSLDEKIIFILLCAKDKVYYSDLLAFEIFPDEIEKISEKLSPFIEIEPVNSSETSSHSTHKLVHNSKLALINKLNELNKDDLVGCIVHIVKTLHNDKSRYRLYIEVILFDTLNQLFGKGRGAGALIYSVYEQLESILAYNLHYWLQRAKSIYRLAHSDYDQLRNAYSYAKKVYTDSHVNSPLHQKGALSTATSAALLYALEKDPIEKQAWQSDVIEFSNEVVSSNDFTHNRKNISFELESQVNRQSVFLRIINTCEDYLTQDFQGDKADKAKNVIQQLKNSN